jgi:hypothetical protein
MDNRREKGLIPCRGSGRKMGSRGKEGGAGKISGAREEHLCEREKRRKGEGEVMETVRGRGRREMQQRN